MLPRSSGSKPQSTEGFEHVQTRHLLEMCIPCQHGSTGLEGASGDHEIALTEMARRHKMKELFNAGLGLTPEELKVEFAPTAADALDDHGLKVAEDKEPYGGPAAPGQ